jgi:hypothetical protein
MRKTLSTLAVAVVVLLSTAARAEWYEVYVNLKPQQYDQWCHAASLQMITDWHYRYKGAPAPLSQCGIAMKEWNSTSCPNNPAYTSELCTGLRNMGYTCSWANDWINATNAIYQFKNYGPFVSQIIWRSGGGHYVVAKAADNAGSQYIKVMDPWPPGAGEASAWMTYTYFRDNYKNDGNWLYSVYGIRR